MKKAILIFLGGVALSNLQAQNAADALRYSNIQQYGGTARTLGSGGVMGALGGDFSALSTNPAGLATYRSNEMTYTASVFGSHTKSDFNNATYRQNYGKLASGNFGFAFVNKPKRRLEWSNTNFGIGFNRLADFGNDFYYEGSTTNPSIVSRFRDQANLEGLNEFESKLADSTSAIYLKRQPSGQFAYVSDFDALTTEPIFRKQKVETRGKVSEMVISFAGNYKEKIQLGATLGIPFLHYSESRSYEEIDNANKIRYFDQLQFNEKFVTEGVGINLKVGVIAKPVKWLRIGLAAHSPTIYTLNDKFSTTFNYQYTDSLRYDQTVSSPDGNYGYRLATPFKAIGSFGFVFSKRVNPLDNDAHRVIGGFLGAEVEYADFGMARFDLFGAENANYENTLNNTIANTYNQALNVRFGGELSYDIFRIRAGYGYSQAVTERFSTTTVPFYSAGVGIRNKHFFMDLGWRGTTANETFTPYRLVVDEPEKEMRVNNKYTVNRFLLTFGFKF